MGRRQGPLGAEMTGYREHDGGPRELRVDIVDREALTTVASLEPTDALLLAGELITEVVRCRRGRQDTGG